MKKIYTFFALLLLFAVTAMAQTTVTVIKSTVDATTYGSLSGEVFTTNATSGMAGVTISGIKGTTATSFNYGACLSLTSTQSGTITITAPSSYLIVGYKLTARSNTWQVPYTLTPSAGGTAVNTSTGGVELNVSGISAQSTSFTYSASSNNSFYIPSMEIYVVEEGASMVNVTYELYDSSDPSTKVSSEIKTQVANSAVNVPSSLTRDDIIYTYAVSGTIGDTDCTIRVTRTKKDDIALKLSDLSNEKVYNIRNNRGTWAVGNGATVVNSTSELNLAFLASDTKQQFAFVTYESNVYLYSVSEQKFAYIDGNKLSLTEAVTDAVENSKITFENSTAGVANEPIIVTVNGYHFGVSTAYSPDVYKYQDQGDAGNCARVQEAGTFDPRNALNALESYFRKKEYYDMIALLESYPYGTGTNQYSLIVGEQNYTAQAKTIIEGMKAQGYTADNFTNAQLLLAGSTLNMPQAGFYRIKGKTSGKYLAGTKTNDGSKFNMSDAVDATTIFYYSGTKLISYSTGMENGMTGNVWAWNYDGEGATVVFQDGLTLGGYAIQSGGNGNFYDSGTSADRGRDVTIDASTNARYTSWYLEPVTELPITLHSVDGTNYFATFSAPVAVRIEGATLNNVTPKPNSISYKAADTKLLPANTGVLLTGTSASATAYVVTDEVADADYGLQAYDAAFTVAEADQTSKLFLGKGSQSGKAGFYALGSAKTNGFKAYFANPSGESGEAKEGFDLVNANETTGVETIDGLTPNPSPNGKGSMYNLQGQRVVKAQKGVFIQNGKKVVVK